MTFSPRGPLGDIGLLSLLLLLLLLRSEIEVPTLLDGHHRRPDLNSHPGARKETALVTLGVGR